MNKSTFCSVSLVSTTLKKKKLYCCLYSNDGSRNAPLETLVSTLRVLPFFHSEALKLLMCCINVLARTASNTTQWCLLIKNTHCHLFAGYYVPKSDGEFYQFCYVTHTGDIRGASTPFQFRSATPTEELLTVTEDDSNSDILVVTTKTGLLEVRYAR